MWGLPNTTCQFCLANQASSCYMSSIHGNPPNMTCAKKIGQNSPGIEANYSFENQGCCTHHCPLIKWRKTKPFVSAGGKLWGVAMMCFQLEKTCFFCGFVVSGHALTYSFLRMREISNHLTDLNLGSLETVKRHPWNIEFSKSCHLRFCLKLEK